MEKSVEVRKSQSLSALFRSKQLEQADISTALFHLISSSYAPNVNPVTLKIPEAIHAFKHQLQDGALLREEI